MRWSMSTTVVLPLVPVTAATLTSSPSSSSPNPTSETMGTPRASAARNTRLLGLMPGLAMILSIPSRTSGPAPRTPGASRAARVSRRCSLSLPSATRTFSPRSASARVVATPDSPSPNTSVLTGSPGRVVEEDVVEEEARGGEGRLGDPEPDHHLVLVPAQKLEVVVDGGHLEDPASRELEDEDLQDHGEGLRHEEAAHDGQEQLRLGQHGGRGEDASYGEGARVAHKDVGGVRVVPEKPHYSADHRAADHRHVVLALQERYRRVGQERYGRSPGGEPVEAVGEVDGVGGARDDEQEEEAEERDPYNPRPQDQTTVEVRHQHGLADAHVAHREHVGQHYRQGQQQELVAGAKTLRPLLGDLLPVVVEPDAGDDGDQDQRRQRRYVGPRHHHERPEQARQHHDPTHGRGARLDEVRLRSLLAYELPELARLQELDELRAEHHGYQERYRRREYNAKQELDSPSTCG